MRSCDEFVSALASAERRMNLSPFLHGPGGGKTKKNGCGISARALASAYEPTYGARIADRCPQVRAFRESRGDVDEPIWSACIWLLKHCEDGEKLSHVWSAGHRYDEAGVDDRLERAVGPTTCAHFGRVNPKLCRGCSYQGQIKSPISLGRLSRAPRGAYPQAIVAQRLSKIARLSAIVRR
ncbi:hypothetical protein [Methylocystis sp. Sn-Cys]|uniref:hypothetical protein n=1 Tax=Methylocystis sp. Sn-Cys TaxID=1701263 RepID=UPI001FEEAFF0|nr:hypothetical protein [Methylocystis sp. Sn-Cys]